MPDLSNPIIETYSRLAKEYDDQANLLSCWGHGAQRAFALLRRKSDCRTVVDMGCGSGRALLQLASSSRSLVQFIGIDPARNMRQIAVQRCASCSNITILDGSFERIPLEPGSVDYLYSIFAFHWTTDLDISVKELARILKPTGEMDIFFIGRHNGREFIQKTTPIFMRYMGPAALLNAARLRKQLTRDGAFQLFSRYFEASRLSVEESFDTYYDSMEGHWGWWVRIEGQFIKIPAAKKQDCYGAVKKALESLAGERGIPYTIHQLHVSIG